MSKKHTLGLIIACIAAAILLTRPASTQTDPADCIELYVNGDLVYESAACGTDPTPTPEPTDTPTSAPTDTPTPTDEPTPTATGTPVPTATSTPASTEPYPDAPLCDSHDDEETHTLWDSARGCHYDHSHGASPEDLQQFFNKWGFDTERIAADSLALGVQTPNENELKHSGYRWFLYEVEGDGCYKTDTGRFDRDGLNNCIVAFAARLHDVGGVTAMTTKLHSMALYTRACLDAGDGTPDLDNCGWSYVAQVNAYGEDDRHELHAPYKQAFAVGFEGDGNFHSPPYVGARTAEECQSRASRGQTCLAVWNSHRDRTNKPGVWSFDYRNFDEWQGIYTNDPLRVDLLGGAYNGSSRHVYEVAVDVPGSGMVTAKGEIPLCHYDDEPCQGTGEYEFHNYPAGWSVYARPNEGPMPDGISVQDVDVYFDGQSSGWLEPFD